MSDGHRILAVTLPVGAPVGRSWDELNAALKDCWLRSTRAANWCVQQLYRRDDLIAAKTPACVKPRGATNPGGYDPYSDAATCTRCGHQWSDQKLPKDRKTGKAKPQCRCEGEPTTKYPDFPRWAGGKQSLNICLRYAHRKYLDERFDVVVRNKSGLLTVRHPYPYPVDKDGWSAGYTKEEGVPSGAGFPTVTLTVPGLGPVTLRLKRRADFGRQLARFRELVSGAAAKCEAALHRNKKGDVLLKLVGKFPRCPAGEKVHACLLHTDPNALLVAEIDGHREWVLNADHLKRRQAVHRAYLQRTAEEAKREKRMDRRQRGMLAASRDRRCEKNRNRLRTAVRQLAAQVVRYCQRQRVGVVVYDDAVRAYMPDGFAWFDLETVLKTRLDEAGVCLVSRNNIDPEEYGEWLANRSLVRATALAGQRLMSTVTREGSHPAVTPKTGRTNSPRLRTRPASVSS